MYGLSSQLVDHTTAFRQAVENGNWWDSAVLLGMMHSGYTRMADILRTLHPAAHENFVNLLIEHLDGYLKEQKALREAADPEKTDTERRLDEAEANNAGRVGTAPPNRKK